MDEEYGRILEARRMAQHDKYFARCNYYMKYFPRTCLFDCPDPDMIRDHGRNGKALISLYYCKKHCQHCKKAEGYMIDAYQCTHPMKPPKETQKEKKRESKKS